MRIDLKIVKALSRTFRDKDPLAKVYLEQVSNSHVLQRDEALVAAHALLAKTGDSYTIESICEVLGHIELIEEVTSTYAAKKAADQQAEAAKLEKEQLAFSKRKAREAEREAKKAEAEDKKQRKLKASEAKAEAQRKQNESRKGKTIFTVKGSEVDDITSIIPVVCKWMASQPDVYVCNDVLCRWSGTKEQMKIISPESLGSLIGLGFSFRNTRIDSLTGILVEEYMSQCPAEHRCSIIATEYYHGIPVVDSVLDRPVVLIDGSVIGTQPGYDDKTKFLFHRTEPVQEIDIEQAYRAIFDVYHEFPQQAVPGALALMFTELMRPCLPTAPMLVVNAPAMGSGKSLIARCCLSIVGSGNFPSLTQPKTDEEFDKQLKSALAKAPGRTLLMDDYTGYVEYQILKTLLTEPKAIEFRILGSNRTLTVRTNVTLVMTGHQVSLTEELERRSVKIHIDTGMEHPSQRSDLSRNSDQLKQHVMDNQSYLRSCAITMLQHALKNISAAHSTRTFGSFEVWADTVGRSVVLCTQKLKDLGLIGPEVEGDVTPNMAAFAAATDNFGETLAAIYAQFEDKIWRVRDLAGESLMKFEDCFNIKKDEGSHKRNWFLKKNADRPRSFGSATYRLYSLDHSRWRVAVVDGFTIPVDPEAELPLDAHMDPRNLEIN